MPWLECELEDEMGSKEGTFGEQYELAMGYKMCSRKWLDWTLPPTDDAGGHFLMDVHKE